MRHDILAADARQIAATLNRDLVRPFVALNFGMDAPVPRLVWPVSAPEDTAVRIESIDRMLQRGLKASALEIRALLRLSDPKAGEETIGGTPFAPALAAPLPRARNRAEDGSAGDDIDALHDAALEEWEAQAEPILDPLVAAVRAASSYEEVRRLLLAALATADAAPLAQGLAAAMAAAARGPQ